jgi:hypothetical protein
MRAYIMHVDGVAYLAFADDAVQAAAYIPAPESKVSVAHSFPVKSGAYKIVTDYGGVLLLDAHGNSLGGMPLRDEQEAAS